jgi:hypothetical protein
MAKKNSETITMRVRIGDRELEITGPCEFVDKKISEFVDHSKKTTGTSGPSVSASSPSGSYESGRRGTSAAQFFKKVAPRTDIDLTLAAAYYLEEIKKYESFNAAEIRDTIQKDAKKRPPKNTSDAVNKNIKKGFMMSAGDKDGKMAFVLTTDGSEYIDTLLKS